MSLAVEVWAGGRTALIRQIIGAAWATQQNARQRRAFLSEPVSGDAYSALAAALAE
jgi:hypothetical protein